MFFVVLSWRTFDGDIVGDPWVVGPFGSEFAALSYDVCHLVRPGPYTSLESIVIRLDQVVAP